MADSQLCSRHSFHRVSQLVCLQKEKNTNPKRNFLSLKKKRKKKRISFSKSNHAHQQSCFRPMRMHLWILTPFLFARHKTMMSSYRLLPKCITSKIFCGYTMISICIYGRLSVSYLESINNSDCGKFEEKAIRTSKRRSNNSNPARANIFCVFFLCYSSVNSAYFSRSSRPFVLKLTKSHFLSKPRDSMTWSFPC